jgi:hypothetical protein
VDVLQVPERAGIELEGHRGILFSLRGGWRGTAEEFGDGGRDGVEIRRDERDSSAYKADDGEACAPGKTTGPGNSGGAGARRRNIRLESIYAAAERAHVSVKPVYATAQSVHLYRPALERGAMFGVLIFQDIERFFERLKPTVIVCSVSIKTRADVIESLADNPYVGVKRRYRRKNFGDLAGLSAPSHLHSLSGIESHSPASRERKRLPSAQFASFRGV